MDHDLIGRKFPVLNDGHVVLLDVMGDDQAIADAARTSYGKGTRKVSEDRDLIRYLMRHRHTTPFEMCEVKLHVRVPMDCWRQWIRHRTASVNEYSTRYSEAIDSCQKTPADQWRTQSVANKQGSSGFLDPSDGLDFTRDEAEFHDEAHELYRRRLKAGIAREQARKDLPLSTYTEAIWKCDLKNLLGFLSLRMDSHAQLEIRSYADVIGREIVAVLFPITWQAFRDYTLDAMSLTALDIAAIRNVLASRPVDSFANKREESEFRAKLERIGLNVL